MGYQINDQLTALGDPTRRAIVERLAGGPLAVVDIARDMPISRPAVSQHLKILKAAHLISDIAHGTRRFYHLDPNGIEAIRAYFDRLWGSALDEYRRVVEAAYRSAPPDPSPTLLPPSTDPKGTSS